MNKLLGIYLIGALVLFGSQKYTGSTTGAVILAGGIIKTQNIHIDKKYKRKDCPVCKGKGWYMSGDGISKVDCGYCEEDKTQPSTDYQKPIIHSPITIKQNCQSGTCSNQSRK